MWATEVLASDLDCELEGGLIAGFEELWIVLDILCANLILLSQALENDGRF